jgi:hypothetical protein
MYFTKVVDLAESEPLYVSKKGSIYSSPLVISSNGAKHEVIRRAASLATDYGRLCREIKAELSDRTDLG